MDDLCLLQHSRKLSSTEVVTARRICAEVADAVKDRNEYVRLHAIDEKFGLPDANWAYEAVNDFVHLYRRIAEGGTDDLNVLRAFTYVFSGFNVHAVLHSRDVPNADLRIGADFDLQLAQRLRERNAAYVVQHRRLVEGLPPAYWLRPPAMFGEVGHVVDGVIVNHDTNAYQERINLLHGAGILARLQRRIEAGAPVRICEIGGGYGALAHWFKQAFPSASYTIVDLPESLLFSRLYLTLTLPGVTTGLGLAEVDSGIRFVPNYMAEELQGPFDLVVNTLSMSEMTEHQIRKYAHLMRRSWLAEDGIFFEQNQDNRHVGMQFAQQVLSTVFEYHYPLCAPGAPFPQGYASVWSVKLQA